MRGLKGDRGTTGDRGLDGLPGEVGYPGQKGDAGNWTHNGDNFLFRQNIVAFLSETMSWAIFIYNRWNLL